MLKTLIKKQFMELFKGYFVNKKTGKARSKGSVISCFILFFALLAVIGAAFYGTSTLLADAFISMKLDWMFYAMMGLIATLLGTFGSVFNTYAGIYHAKDNEQLLSMPIKPSQILFSRIAGVYLLGLLYEAIVIVPATICYWFRVELNFFNIVFPVILWFVLGFLVSAITCLLGWIVAVISSKLKNKNFITVIASLAFFGIYYFVCFKFNSLLTNIIQNAEQLSVSIKSAVFPAYAFGMGSCGSLLYLLLFCLIAGVLFALTYYIMSRSFIKITTSAKSTKKNEFKFEQIKTGNIKSTLFNKEMRRFLSSPTYMMNCGLGLVIMPLLAVIAIIKSGTINAYIGELFPQIVPLLPVFASGIVCTMLSTNPISAPSVSLEGKSIWVMQSLPVNSYDALSAKAKLHFVMNSVPATITTVILGLVLKAGILTTVFMCVSVIAFAEFSALFGLFLNLNLPNLSWTNETIPIKQSLSVTISLFGGWIISLGFFGVYFLLSQYFKAYIYLAIVAALFALISVMLNVWMKKKGSCIFAQL